MSQHFVYLDDSEQHWLDILTNHADEAQTLARRLVHEGQRTEEGCIVTDTTTPRRSGSEGSRTLPTASSSAL